MISIIDKVGRVARLIIYCGYQVVACKAHLRVMRPFLYLKKRLFIFSPSIFMKKIIVLVISIMALWSVSYAMDYKPTTSDQKMVTNFGVQLETLVKSDLERARTISEKIKTLVSSLKTWTKNHWIISSIGSKLDELITKKDSEIDLNDGFDAFSGFTKVYQVVKFDKFIPEYEKAVVSNTDYQVLWIVWFDKTNIKTKDLSKAIEAGIADKPYFYIKLSSWSIIPLVWKAVSPFVTMQEQTSYSIFKVQKNGIDTAKLFITDKVSCSVDAKYCEWTFVANLKDIPLISYSSSEQTKREASEAGQICKQNSWIFSMYDCNKTADRDPFEWMSKTLFNHFESDYDLEISDSNLGDHYCKETNLGRECLWISDRKVNSITNLYYK